MKKFGGTHGYSTFALPDIKGGDVHPKKTECGMWVPKNKIIWALKKLSLELTCGETNFDLKIKKGFKRKA
jgi:hypothetical protein